VAEHQRALLPDLQFGQVVIPDLPCRPALGEEKQVGLDARARRREHAARQADHAPEVAVVQQFPFRLDEGVFVRAEQQPLVKDDPAPAAVAQIPDDMLKEQHLRCAGLVIEVGLCFLSFLAAEGRVRQDHVESLRRALEQAAVGFLSRQGVAVPEVRLVDAVQHQVGQSDGKDEILFLPAPECPLLERFELVGRLDLFVVGSGHVLERLRQKAARAAAGIVNGLFHAGIDYLHHRLDDLARREKLAAVVSLLAHLQEQPLIDLRKGEDMRRVNRVSR